MEHQPKSKSQRWRTTEEKEYLSTIRGFIKICQYFCVAPYHCMPDAKFNSFYTFKSICHLIWCVILLIIIISATWYQYGGFDRLHVTFLLKILYFGEYISGMSNCILMMCGCYYQRKKYAYFIKRIWNVFVVITKMDNKHDFSCVKNLWQRCCAIYIIVFTFILFVDFMYNGHNVLPFILSSTVYCLPNIIGILALTQYIILLYVIRLGYVRVHKFIIDGKYDDDDAKCSLVKMPNFLFPIKEFASNTVNVFNDTCDAFMERLRLICLDLCELHRDINNMFGLILINTILSTFIILNTQFYTFYRIFEHIHIESKEQFWLTIYTMLWIILHSGKVLAILICNHRIYETKSAISTQIYRINCASKSNHIFRFALQALNESERDYTFGMLKLDLSLLPPIIGALTTYLVILIQFDIATRPASTSTNI